MQKIRLRQQRESLKKMYHDSFAARNKAFYTIKLPRKGEGRTESYTYDANGNRATKTTASVTITYRYDAENRLVSSGANGRVAVTCTGKGVGCKEKIFCCRGCRGKVEYLIYFF